MLIFKTESGRTLKATFMHSSHDGITRDGASQKREVVDEMARGFDRRLTMCELTEDNANGEGYSELGVGIALCHPNDTFKKSTGIKLSLTYALEAASPEKDALGMVVGALTTPDGVPLLTREDRKDIWDQFRAGQELIEFKRTVAKVAAQAPVPAASVA